MPIGTAKSKLVVALTLFAALAVGLTGASLLTRSRAALLQGIIERQNLLVQTRAQAAAGPDWLNRDPPPSLEEVEQRYLGHLLERAHGNRSQVARWMGVSYPTVVKKIADYGIDLSRWKG
jgi:DNA-binding NtrC family response regulator